MSDRILGPVFLTLLRDSRLQNVESRNELLCRGYRRKVRSRQHSRIPAEANDWVAQSRWVIDTRPSSDFPHGQAFANWKEMVLTFRIASQRAAAVFRRADSRTECCADSGSHAASAGRPRGEGPGDRKEGVSGGPRVEFSECGGPFQTRSNRVLSG